MNEPKEKTTLESFREWYRDTHHARLSIPIQERVTLTEALKELGYTHKRSTKKNVNQYAHDVFKDGEVVFTGTALEVWRWIKGSRFVDEGLEFITIDG